MPRDVTFAPGSFGAWLQTNKGVASFKDVPGLYQTTATRLHRGEMAPNSPMLPPFADRLGVSLETLQAFATAPPLGPKWVNKIKGQLANGTIPRGDKTRHHAKHAKHAHKRAKHAAPPAKHPSNHSPRNASPLARLLAERSGMPVGALAQKLGITTGTMSRLTAGQLGANHPLLPPLATALKLELRVLQRYMHGRRLDAGGMARARTTLRAAAKAHKAHAAKEPGTALVHVPREAAPAKVKAKAKKPDKYNKYNKYNKLRSKPLELRDAARAMCATLNVAVMRGDTHSPPLPLRELHLVLVDYLTAKGVRTNVLVDPEFATLFDPR